MRAFAGAETYRMFHRLLRRGSDLLPRDFGQISGEHGAAVNCDGVLEIYPLFDSTNENDVPGSALLCKKQLARNIIG